MQQAAGSIKKWFADSIGGSLLFPDGWYGRPHDNIHQLTNLVEEPNNAILIVLDKVLKLRFVGVAYIKLDPNQIAIGFTQLKVEWEGFGHPEMHGIKEYRSGELRIVR
jgi:hypothetical protein